VRHLDWFMPSQAARLNHLLEHLGVGRVLLDTRPIYEGIDPAMVDPQMASERKKPRVPLQPVVTAPFILVRYISHPTLAVNRPYFEDWVPRLQQWLQAGQQVYFFAHCPEERKSPAIARAVYHRLHQAGASLPPLPWDLVEQQRAEDDHASAQLSLFES
ncbi:MAG TPA: DUF72 domain-containing protein, partial [Leptolyngbyaceae cyanobacterium M65_K2018_010]|nr:DUF72 domain-containing protein [Leptolyngbyaceae cyanobacterium M65_K2018_010]